MLLKEIMPEFYLKNLDTNCQISSIETDSRLIKPNAIFFAFKGSNFDGIKFIENAFLQGAALAICSQDCSLSALKNPQNPLIIKVANIEQFLLDCLNKFYCNLPKNIFAITGTNGKSSVVYFILQMMEILGRNAASIGTAGVKIAYPNSLNASKTKVNLLTELNQSTLTTPDIVSIYKNLALLKANNIENVAIEASSIGLDQGRLSGLKIGLGAFTNFTQDHLDYHQTMDKYFASKMLLFNQIMPKGALAVLNADIPEFEKIKNIVQNNNLEVLSYSSKQKKILSYKQSKLAEDNFQLINQAQDFTSFSPLVKFQHSNIMCALACVAAYYQPNPQEIELLLANLKNLKSENGRMELAAILTNSAKVIIDFAHSPDAITNVLGEAKAITKNNLYILFGCGGQRDQDKRAKMGRIASDLADYVIITDDNPREENADKIREDILQGCDLSKTTQIQNRQTAIEQTILRLKTGDVMIVAGKGDEKYQIIGKEKLPFNERQIINQFVKTIN